MRHGLALSFVLALAAQLPGIALADIAPDPEYGQSLSPADRTSVAMTEETVTVTLGKNGARVKAVFHLKNTGAATSLEVGFPDVARASSHSSGKPPEKFSGYKLLDFTAKVNGSAVEHGYRWVKNQESPRENEEIERKIRELRERLKKAGNPKERESIERDLNWQERRLGEWAWYGWLVWKMEFRPGEKQIVEVEYSVPYRPPYRPTHLRAAAFEYVLKTGALWKDSIGRALIEVKFADGLSAKHIVSAAPSGYAQNEEGISWDLKNIEPSEDIQISLNQYADHAAAAMDYMAKSAEASLKGDKTAAALHLAWAAECQQKAGSYADCVESCRRIIALEKESRSGDRKGPSFVKTWWKAAYVPWECMIVECFKQLGKNDEAKAAAVEAISACRALLDSKERSPRFGFNRDDLEKRISDLEAFLAG